MKRQKPMRLILIEDDAAACKDFADFTNGRTDVLLVGVTNNSKTGLDFVKNKLPEAVILDLELNMGEGSGYDFLEDFAKTRFKVRPIIVITTRNRNDSLHIQLHSKHEISWIFYKLQKGYGPEMVIRHLLRFRDFYQLKASGMEIKTGETPETPNDVKNRIISRIKAELDVFGISVKLKGRLYAEEAVYLLVNKSEGSSDSVFQDVAKAFNTNYNNIIRAMQTAINDAWRNADDIDVLFKHYTAPVRKDLGTPSPTEFVHYYADMIRRDIF